MDYVLDPEQTSEVPLAGRGRFYTAYWGSSGRAAVALYEVDGNQKALGYAIVNADILMARQNSYFGKPSTSNGKVEAGWLAYFNGEFFNETMANGMTIIPMIELLKLSKRDPWVRARLGEARYQAWMKNIRPSLVQFDDIRREEEGLVYFEEPFLNSGESVRWVEAWNHVSIYGAALIEYYALTKDPEIKRRA